MAAFRLVILQSCFHKAIHPFTLARVYGILLSIFKIIAEALTAGFGILGLLTDFKDDQKKITPAGRKALVGILASFVVSGVITVLENANSRAEERLHEQQIEALEHPLGDMSAGVALSFPSSGTGELIDYAQTVRKAFTTKTSPTLNLLQNDRPNGLRSFYLEGKSVPSTLLLAAPASLDEVTKIVVYVLGPGSNCDGDPLQKQKPKRKRYCGEEDAGKDLGKHTMSIYRRRRKRVGE